MRTKQAIEVVEIVRTYDVGPIQMPPGIGDDFRFRIEILRASARKRQYQARVWRIETYRVQPTFPQKKGRPTDDPCDELLLVRDHSLDDHTAGSTPERALRAALATIKSRFVPTPPARATASR
jgi:hypothetical protein